MRSVTFPMIDEQELVPIITTPEMSMEYLVTAAVVAKWIDDTVAAFTFGIADVGALANSIRIVGHLFQAQDMPVQLTTSGTLPTGLALATTYFIDVVDADTLRLLATAGGSVVDFSDVGTGTHTITPLAEASLVLNADWIFGTNTVDDIGHTFVDEELVQLTTTGTLPAGLSLATDYFIIFVDANSYQLELTVGGGAAPFTDAGTGDHTVTRFSVADDMEVLFPDGDEILESPSHGLLTEQVVRVSTSGTLPAPLLAATDYYVIVLDADSLQLATTRALAIAGTPINITDVGVGTHTLTPSAIAGTVQLQAANSVRVPIAADWIDFGSAITIPGAGSPLDEAFADFGYRWIRAVWTPTGGTGTLSVTICAKGIGGT